MVSPTTDKSLNWAVVALRAGTRDRKTYLSHERHCRRRKETAENHAASCMLRNGSTSPHMTDLPIKLHVACKLLIKGDLVDGCLEL